MIVSRPFLVSKDGEFHKVVKSLRSNLKMVNYMKNLTSLLITNGVNLDNRG